MAYKIKENRGKTKENYGINRAFKIIKSKNMLARKP